VLFRYFFFATTFFTAFLATGFLATIFLTVFLALAIMMFLFGCFGSGLNVRRVTAERFGALCAAQGQNQ
jgi:hypothetical protein